jgi:formylglycine-generating enzyme required for sulfatase activity
MNLLGFYDLGGNVREWMGDGLDENTRRRGLRGGGWGRNAEYCTVAARDYNFGPEWRISDYGFRVALSSVP